MTLSDEEGTPSQFYLEGKHHQNSDWKQHWAIWGQFWKNWRIQLIVLNRFIEKILVYTGS